MRFSSESLKLPDGEFQLLRDLIRGRLGLDYDESKREMLADRLSRRAVAQGFESFIDYYYLLKYGPGADEEWSRLMEELSVPETYFWREFDQVKALVDFIVPEYFSQSRESPLRIWSAACASGEEPLTIAMALEDAGWLRRAPIEIVASDGSAAAINKARAGLYRERSFRSLPSSVRTRYFTEQKEGWRVSPAVHAAVRWETINLLSSQEVARMLPAQVVFCRNVFIYFSADAIRTTLQRFAAGMAPPACLFVGASESLLRTSTEFELAEIGEAFVYRKIGAVRES